MRQKKYYLLRINDNQYRIEHSRIIERSAKGRVWWVSGLGLSPKLGFRTLHKTLVTFIDPNGIFLKETSTFEPVRESE